MSEPNGSIRPASRAPRYWVGAREAPQDVDHAHVPAERTQRARISIEEILGVGVLLHAYGAPEDEVRTDACG